MAAAEHGIVVYQRGEQDGESDAWDDTVLIKAYDSAVSAMKAKLAEQHPEFAPAQSSTKMKKKRTKSKSKKKKTGGTGKWKQGDLCKAIYSEDGEIYEACILSIDEDAETCTVQYVGYGNEEEHLLSNLLPLASEESSQDMKTDTVSDTGSLHQAPTLQDANSESHRSKKTSSSQHQNIHGRRRTPKCPWNNYAPPPPFTQMPQR
uniref:Tudor domain-containing protein n=1 Tax=Arion vulgaris TaxID=1028688 RepID=A0A0B6Z9K9_9EUPU